MGFSFIIVGMFDKANEQATVEQHSLIIVMIIVDKDELNKMFIVFVKVELVD